MVKKLDTGVYLLMLQTFQLSFLVSKVISIEIYLCVLLCRSHEFMVWVLWMRHNRNGTLVHQSQYNMPRTLQICVLGYHSPDSSANLTMNTATATEQLDILLCFQIDCHMQMCQELLICFLFYYSILSWPQVSFSFQVLILEVRNIKHQYDNFSTSFSHFGDENFRALRVSYQSLFFFFCQL